MDSSSPRTNGPKAKGSYPLYPTPFVKFWLDIIAYCTVPLYLILEIVSEIRAVLLCLLRNPSRKCKGIHERQTEASEHLVPSKSNVLEDWLARPSYMTDSYEFMYPTRRLRLQVVVFSAIFAAFRIIATILIRLDRDPHGTAIKLRTIVKSMRRRAEASAKFHRVFEKYIVLLRDIEESSAASISSFLRNWSTHMSRKGSMWFLRHVHRRTNCIYVPEALYETTLAQYALFHASGGGFEAYYMNGHWKEKERCIYGAVTMLMYFVIDKCYPEPWMDLVKTTGCGLEQILLVNREMKFVRFIGLMSTEDEGIRKDLLMWDITRNCCNEFVESSWSVSCLERVIWTLEHGLRHVSMELYESLKALNGQRRMDMTHLNALSLVTLSVAGLVRLRGMGDGPYEMFSSGAAAVEVHGQLPGVTIKDLVELKLVDKMQGGRFCMRRLPGCDRRFKAVRVGDKIKFVASVKSEVFWAKDWQQVV